MMRNKTLLILLSLFLSLAVVSTSQAKPFYEDKVIKLIVTTKPGGGYDFYGRLLARGFEKYLPGCTVIVKNIPGAGHLVGTNTIYKSKPNGLTVGTFNRAIGILQVAGIKGVRFDFTKFSWIGTASSELYSYCVRSDIFKNLDDVMNAQNTKLATSGLGGMNHITAVLFYYMMNKNNYSIGTGYAGGETSLAIMRGEMDGSFGSFFSRKGMVDDGYARYVMFIGGKDMQQPGFEDVPFIQDIVKDSKHKSLVDFLVGMQITGRPFAGPPGIPKDRLTILRKAFKNSVNDPEFHKFAKRSERPLNYISAEQTDTWAKGIFDLPSDAVKIIRKAHGGM